MTDSKASLRLEGVAGADKPLGAYIPGVSTTLSLRGARGETLNFLLRISGPNHELARNRILLSALRGAKGPHHPARICFYSMPFIHTIHPSFKGAFVGDLYDPLIPALGNEVDLTLGKKGNSSWVFGELEIPPEMGPGDYEMTARLGTHGANSLRVKLRVWDLVMPESPALPAYSEYQSWGGVLGHYGQYQKGAESALAKKYLAEMYRHRIAPLKTWIRRPSVVGDSGPLRLDLERFPSPGESYATLRLQDAPLWAYLDFPPPDRKDNTENAKMYWSALDATVKALHLDSRAMVYFWDEPRRTEMKDLVSRARIAKKAAPDLKFMVTAPYSRELEPWVDIFVPLMRGFEPGAKPGAASYRRLQKRGKQVWWYISCTSHGCGSDEDDRTPDLVIDLPASYVRSIAWLSRLYGINAFLYYSVNEGYGKMPKADPWKDLWDFSGNGDGTLFYPGRPGLYGLSEHIPVPSIRLKLWREASYDAEYLRWVSRAVRRGKKPSWWPKALNSLIQTPRLWDRDYGAYQRLRDRIGDYLDSLARPSAATREGSGSRPSSIAQDSSRKRARAASAVPAGESKP